MTATADDLNTLAEFFQACADALAAAREHPHGPVSTPEERQLAGRACISFCNGDQDQARTLWKLITTDLGGYMPQAAALALIRASSTSNLVPDVQEPELS